MKTKKKLLAIAALLTATISFSSAQYTPPPPLQGDVKLSCEAILCLASPTKPSECMASIRKYFGFSARKFKDVKNMRKNFLNLCPIMTDSTAKIFESAGIDINEQAKEINDFKNTVLEMPHDCSADSLNKNVQATEENRNIFNKYIDRLVDKKPNLTNYEKDQQKRRLKRGWGGAWGDDDYKLKTVYRVNPIIPKACENFYKHSWSPNRPKHTGNNDWYYSNEFAKMPNSIWQ